MYLIWFSALPAQSDASSCRVNFQNGDFDDLSGCDNFSWIFDEVISQLRDVNESILMDSDINKGAEFCDVCDDTFEFHTGLEVFEFRDAIGEASGLKFAARVTSRSGEFCNDIADGEFSGITADEVCGAELCGQVGSADQFCGVGLESAGHFLYERVLFGVYGGGIEWF